MFLFCHFLWSWQSKYVREVCIWLCEGTVVLRQWACGCSWKVLGIVQTCKACPSYRSCFAEKFIVCNWTFVFLENTYVLVCVFCCGFPCKWIYVTSQLTSLTTTDKFSTLLLFHKQYFLPRLYFWSICVYLEAILKWEKFKTKQGKEFSRWRLMFWISGNFCVCFTVKVTFFFFPFDVTSSFTIASMGVEGPVYLIYFLLFARLFGSSSARL